MRAAFGPLPSAVKVNGCETPVDPDFRWMVSFETAVLGGRQEELAEIMERFYLGRIPEALDGAAEALLWFYRCGRESAQGEGGGEKRCYDFRQDADALYASFYQAYHTDLRKGALHWWAFRQLMFGLPEDTPFMQRVYIRTVDTTGMGREEKKRYAKLKQRFAVREDGRPMTLEERDAWMKAYVGRRFREARNGT